MHCFVFLPNIMLSDKISSKLLKQMMINISITINIIIILYNKNDKIYINKKFEA